MKQSHNDVLNKRKSKMKNVLFIAYFFPPLGGAGTLRSLKFVKYLSHFGWNPIVLTVKEGHEDVYDYSLLSEIPPQTKIFRTKSFEPTKLSRLLQGRLIREPTYKATKSATKQSVFSRAIGFIVNNYLFIPENKIGWFPFAVRAELQIMRKYKPDLIFSTSGPITCHLIALRLKKLTGKPWVADFRDIWTQGPHSAEAYTLLRQKINVIIEHKILHAADKIVVVNKGMVDTLLENYPDLTRGKFTVIPNGFDHDDFLSIRRTSFDKFTITYTGITRSGWALPFFKALQSLIAEHKELSDDIQVFFLGEMHGCKDDWNFVRKNGLERIITFKDYVPHHIALEYICKSHVLLFLLGFREQDSKYYGASKIYEYMFTGKPILTICPEGFSTEFVRKIITGVVIQPENVVGIKQQIWKLYEKYKDGSLKTTQKPTPLLSKFERKNLTKKLAQTFEEVLDN